jgi:hypothetical protein
LGFGFSVLIVTMESRDTEETKDADMKLKRLLEDKEEEIFELSVSLQANVAETDHRISVLERSHLQQVRLLEEELRRAQQEANIARGQANRKAQEVLIASRSVKEHQHHPVVKEPSNTKTRQATEATDVPTGTAVLEAPAPLPTATATSPPSPSLAQRLVCSSVNVNTTTQSSKRTLLWLTQQRTDTQVMIYLMEQAMFAKNEFERYDQLQWLHEALGNYPMPSTKRRSGLPDHLLLPREQERQSQSQSQVHDCDDLKSNYSLNSVQKELSGELIRLMQAPRHASSILAAQLWTTLRPYNLNIDIDTVHDNDSPLVHIWCRVANHVLDTDKTMNSAFLKRRTIHIDTTENNEELHLQTMSAIQLLDWMSSILLVLAPTSSNKDLLFSVLNVLQLITWHDEFVWNSIAWFMTLLKSDQGRCLLRTQTVCSKQEYCLSAIGVAAQLLHQVTLQPTDTDNKYAFALVCFFHSTCLWAQQERLQQAATRISFRSLLSECLGDYTSAAAFYLRSEEGQIQQMLRVQLDELKGDEEELDMIAD